jgi:hypothetical protein
VGTFINAWSASFWLKQERDVEFFLTAIPRGNEVEILLLLYRAVLLYFQNTTTFYRRIFWEY